MIRGIVRYLVGRRLARLLPGGWLLVLLTGPHARRLLARAWWRWRRGPSHLG